MFKIRLLILLLVNVLVLSCTNTQKNNYKFKLEYVGGELDGLIYSNILKSYLGSLKMYDQLSQYVIHTEITHTTNLYISNVNNTSDREKVNSYIRFFVIDEILNCKVYEYENQIDQFYVLTPNINFSSNKIAVQKIKDNNAEILALNIVNLLSSENNLRCLDVQ